MASLTSSAEDDGSSATSSRSAPCIVSPKEQSKNNGNTIMLRPSSSFHDDPSVKVDVVPPDIDVEITLRVETSRHSRSRVKLFVTTLFFPVVVGFLLRISFVDDFIRGGGREPHRNKSISPYDAKDGGEFWPFVEPPSASGLEVEIKARGKLGDLYTLTFYQEHLHCKQKYEVTQPDKAQCSYSIPLGDTKLHESTEEEEEGMLMLYQKSNSYFAPEFVRTFLDDFPDDIVLILGRDAEDTSKYRLILMTMRGEVATFLLIILSSLA